MDPVLSLGENEPGQCGERRVSCGCFSAVGLSSKEESEWFTNAIVHTNRYNNVVFCTCAISSNWST